MNIREILEQLETNGFSVEKSTETIHVIAYELNSEEWVSWLKNYLFQEGLQTTGRGQSNQKVTDPREQQLFVKQYYHGGVFNRSADCHYRSPERFFREALAGCRARNAGIAVPEPIAVVAQDQQQGWVGYYLSRYISGQSLGRYIRKTGDQTPLERAGQTLARLHALGLDPLDYHIENLLLNDQNELVYTDFDPVRFREPGRWKRALRRHRFNRSLRKRGFLFEDSKEFLRGYRSVSSSGAGFYSLQKPGFYLKNRISDLIYHCSSERPIYPENREKILIRVPNWLGDNIMALPFIEQLNQSEATDQIDITVRRGLSDLYRAVPAVDTIWPLPNDKTLSMPEQLSDERYSLAITIPKSLRTGIQLWRTGIPRRLGFSTQGRGIFLTDRVPLEGRDRTVHHAKLYQTLAENFIPPNPSDSDFQLELPEEWKEAIGCFSLPAKYLVFHPGTAYGPAKRWPPEQFSEFLREWIDHHSTHVVAVGVPDEQDIANEILRELPDKQAIDLIGNTSLGECMAVLKQATACVANDSGIMHLSAALGTPTVGIFGSSSPDLTSPLGPKTSVLYRNVDCSPCFEKICPLDEDRYRCLREITPESVLQDIEKLAE